ncbi:hypothetical protein J6590_103548, partial [Homalodisca vitripennis]
GIKQVNPWSFTVGKCATTAFKTQIIAKHWVELKANMKVEAYYNHNFYFTVYQNASLIRSHSGSVRLAEF